MDWGNTPEPVLRYIFNLLKNVDLHNASLTCKYWYFISCDNISWKRRLHRDFKLRQTVPIKDQNSTWKEEYRRLVEDIPMVLSQVSKD